jgi:hypothetical protein
MPLQRALTPRATARRAVFFDALGSVALPARNQWPSAIEVLIQALRNFDGRQPCWLGAGIL